MAGIAWWPWLTLAGLGALHGLNPGMGWLFAVALGLQEGSARAVWRALPPLALGHALAVALAVTIAAAVGGWIPIVPLRWGVAVILLTFGVFRLIRHAHPRYGGMRVGARQLTIWSFLMATAHGAGLMILPVVLAGANPIMGRAAPGVRAGAHTGMGHAMPIDATAETASRLAGMPAELTSGLAVTAVHTAGYLAVAVLLAGLVYARFGVRILRSAWINLDLIWAVALIGTALVTPFL